MDAFARYQAQAGQLLRDPDDPAALVGQFSLLARHGEHTGAQLALAARAAALAPMTFEAVFNLGSAQIRAGRYQEALDTFRRSLALAGSCRTEAMHHVGMAHHDLGPKQSTGTTRRLRWRQTTASSGGAAPSRCCPMGSWRKDCSTSRSIGTSRR
jgi:hypothetical protein